jgi:hypothetical protein
VQAERARQPECSQISLEIPPHQAGGSSPWHTGGIDSAPAPGA